MPLFKRRQTAYLVEYQEQESLDLAMFSNPVLDREVSRRFGHYFCGEHEIVGADCPNCRKPLLRFLTLDTADQRIGLSQLGVRFIHCLFCWTCNLGQKPFYYQHEDNGAIKLLKYGEGGVETDFPYEDYPIAFPGAPIHLLELSDTAQKAIKSWNSGGAKFSSFHRAHPDIFGCKHQVGGEPFLILRNPDYGKERDLRCPQCEKTMPFFAAIADDCLDERGMTDNEGVQALFHLCRSCLTIGAIQQCD